MKFKAAQTELVRILAEQKSVATPKLKMLLESLNISLKREQTENLEIIRLKEEITRLKHQLNETNRANARLHRKLDRLREEIKENAQSS